MAESDQGRIKARRRTILGGKVFDDEGLMIKCTIMDLSTTGARIRCTRNFENSDFVNLKIDRFEELQRSEVMWRRDGQIGLQFVNEMTNIPKRMVAIFELLNRGSSSK